MNIQYLYIILRIKSNYSSESFSKKGITISAKIEKNLKIENFIKNKLLKFLKLIIALIFN